MSLPARRNAVGSRPRSFAGRLRHDLVRYRFIYFLMLPALLYFFIFHYGPMYFLQIAFKDYSVFRTLENSKWIGLGNFQALFQTRFFWQAFRNTLIISSMRIAVGFPIPILLSLLLNELLSNRFKRTVQTLIYMPHFLSWVIVAGIWMNLLSPVGGIVNELRGALFGLEPRYYMADMPSSPSPYLMLYLNISFCCLTKRMSFLLARGYKL